jgi:RNA polymerase sigma-70 factor, ECF subfamily
MLAEDATLAMPPTPSWYRGRAAVGAFLAARPFSRPRQWRLVPVRANGQPAFGGYKAEGGGRAVAHSIVVLTLHGDGRIAALTAFFETEAFARFGLPDEIGKSSK